MGDRIAGFRLFPLGIVALPGEVVPLHVFEPRYRTMIGECLEEGEPFGIIWQAADGLKEVGCACAVTEVLERTPDGGMNILAEGRRPFRLLERRDDRPYPAGIAELLDDKPETPHERTVEEARTLYARLVREATDRELEPAELADLDAYAMAARIELGLEAKQGLLALRSENARLRLVARLLRSALERIELMGRVQARARSNGRVRFG